MPLTKYRANFLYDREELFALFACAEAGDVEHGGRYDARGGVLYVWSHAWRTQALRDESTLVGSLYFDWLTDCLTQIEWDEGFELADLLYELASSRSKPLARSNTANGGQVHNGGKHRPGFTVVHSM